MNKSIQNNNANRVPVVVLAGGIGNRLSPLTLRQPKPTLPFVACRLIDFTLSNCVRSGLTDVALLTQYRHQQIQDHVDRNWEQGFVCLPPRPGAQYRGTADAVFQNLSRLENADHVLILGGDHVYRMDYQDLIQAHINAGADLTLCTVENPRQTASSFGVVEVDDDLMVREFVEKPARPKPMPHRPDISLVSMGIYVFRVSALVNALQRYSASDTGFDFGYQIVPSLIKSGRVFAYDFCDVSGKPCYWKDVGDIDSYYSSSMDFLGPNPPFPRLVVGRCVSNISGGAGRISNTILCGDVDISNDVEIEDSILMPGVRVEAGARLRRVIVDEGSHIPEGFVAEKEKDVAVISRVPEGAEAAIPRRRNSSRHA
jgi:glucose-1-phosphate adenylyltransferase